MMGKLFLKRSGVTLLPLLVKKNVLLILTPFPFLIVTVPVQLLFNDNLNVAIKLLVTAKSN
jgi:hypothetical protein